MMKYRVYGLVAVGFGALLAAAPLVAHHEILAKFDDKKPVTVKGTITKVDWANPHVHLFMNVQTGNVLANYAVELESPVDLVTPSRCKGFPRATAAASYGQIPW